MSENIFFDLKDLKYCGENVIIGKTVRIRNPELVEIGDYTIIDDFTYISGEADIGQYAHIAASCSLQASKSKITIGDFAGLASGVRVFAASADYIKCSFDTAPVPQQKMYGGIFDEVIIDDLVWIGANSVILPGVKLPIGFTAGALMKLEKNYRYKPWTIINGNPIIEHRRLFKDKLVKSAQELTGKEYEF